jgi:hypothetical protein
MDIVVDSTVNFSRYTNAVTHTVSFNNVGGTLLLVGFECLRNVAGDSISSVTYNGITLTKIAHQKGSVNNRTANMWKLLSPDTGTHDLVITLVATERVSGTIETYTGQDLTSPIDVVANTTTSGTTVTFPITTITDKSALFLAAQSNRTTTAAGTNTTLLLSDGNVVTARSTAVVTPLGATTLGCTFSTSDPGVPYIIIAIKPAAAASTFIPRITFM